MAEERQGGQGRGRKGVSFFGLSISTSVDISAVLAFLSFATITLTVGVDMIYFFRGSVADVYLPSHVQFVVDDCAGKKVFNYVGVIVQVSAFNTGKYDDLIRKERLYMSVGGLRMQLYPYRVVRSAQIRNDADYCKDREIGEFRGTKLTFVDTVQRVSIQAGSARSREILFVADSEMCGDDLADCVNHDSEQYIRRQHIGKGDFGKNRRRKITIEVRLAFLEDGMKSKMCVVDWREPTVTQFEEAYTVTVPCREISQDYRQTLYGLGDGYP